MSTSLSRFAELVSHVKNNIKEVAAEEIKNKIQQKENFYLVDVREESEWQRGQIPQALHLSKGVLEVNIEKVITDPESEIVLYCGGGSRSALAAENLQRMGYKNVFSLAGGFRGWTNSGFEVEIK